MGTRRVRTASRQGVGAPGYEGGGAKNNLVNLNDPEKQRALLAMKGRKPVELKRSVLGRNFGRVVFAQVFNPMAEAKKKVFFKEFLKAFERYREAKGMRVDKVVPGVPQLGSAVFNYPAVPCLR